MLQGLNELQSLVKQPAKPKPIEVLYYLFWERGIDLHRFNELPLPYIFSMLRVFTHIKHEEQKKLDEIKRRR